MAKDTINLEVQEVTATLSNLHDDPEFWNSHDQEYYEMLMENLDDLEREIKMLRAPLMEAYKRARERKK
jgi:hypothetical protein